MRFQKYQDTCGRGPSFWKFVPYHETEMEKSRRKEGDGNHFLGYGYVLPIWMDFGPQILQTKVTFDKFTLHMDGFD